MFASISWFSLSLIIDEPCPSLLHFDIICLYQGSHSSSYLCPKVVVRHIPHSNPPSYQKWLHIVYCHNEKGGACSTRLWVNVWHICVRTILYTCPPSHISFLWGPFWFFLCKFSASPCPASIGAANAISKWKLAFNFVLLSRDNTRQSQVLKLSYSCTKITAAFRIFFFTLVAKQNGVFRDFSW